MVDMRSLVDSYLRREVRGGADDHGEGHNCGMYCFAGLMDHVSGAVVAEYSLNTMYDANVRRAHRNGDLCLTGLSRGIVGHSAEWDARVLLAKGFNGGGHGASSAPARHFNSALSQIINFICTMQTEWADTQTLGSFDTLLAPFARADGLGSDAVEQSLQRFIFGLNTASRWGGTPFANLGFDLVPPDWAANSPVVVGGVERPGDFHGDYRNEMEMINRAFVGIMAGGDMDGKPFECPVPVYPADIDNLPATPATALARSLIENADQRHRRGPAGVPPGNRGVLGVVGINVRKLLAGARNQGDALSSMHRLMDLARDALETKRRVVERGLRIRLLPYSRLLLDGLGNHLSVIVLDGTEAEPRPAHGGGDSSASIGNQTLDTLIDLSNKLAAKYQRETGNTYLLKSAAADFMWPFVNGRGIRLGKVVGGY